MFRVEIVESGMKTNGRVRRKVTSAQNTHNLTAVIYPDSDSDWLIAHNPETGTTTQGKTLAEALANLKEASVLYLSEFPLRSKNTPIVTTFEAPMPNAPKGDLFSLPSVGKRRIGPSYQGHP